MMTSTHDIEYREAGGVWIEEKAAHLQLREIQLLPDFRGFGIGTELIRHCIDTAKTEKKPLRLRVLKTNPAVRLYERLGFRVEGFREASQHLLMVQGE
jgi:GNAT superfamily N-acetyltransferase